MRTIIIATSNKGKVKEIKESTKIFQQIKTIDDKYKSPEETGLTFAQNAYIKAKEAYDIYKEEILADDSGLCIKSLSNLPGIKSARIAEENGGFQGAIDYLFNLKEELTGKKEESLEAYFECSLCYIDKEGKAYYFKGKVEGKIYKEGKGELGFGYDAYFEAAGYEERYAQNISIKEKTSHRKKALEKFNQYIESK